MTEACNRRANIISTVILITLIRTLSFTALRVFDDCTGKFIVKKAALTEKAVGVASHGPRINHSI